MKPLVLIVITFAILLFPQTTLAQNDQALFRFAQNDQALFRFAQNKTASTDAVTPQSSCKPANPPALDDSCNYVPVVDKNNCVIDYQELCPPPAGGPTPTPLPTPPPAGGPKPGIWEIFWNWLNSLFS